MKRKIKFLGLTCLAVFVLSAMAAASASADEFVPETGTFPIPFTSTSGAGTLETSSGETVTCSSDTNTGSITGPMTFSVIVKFKGCKTTFFGFPIACKTSGAGTEEIVTKTLDGELGTNAAKKVLADLVGEGAGEVVAEFECLGNTVKVTGSVIGVFPNTGVFLHETELVLKQTKGIQEFTETINTEGKTIKNVLSSSKNGGAKVQSGETTTDKIVLTEAGRKVKIQ
jgi:hypothetical protein